MHEGIESFVPFHVIALRGQSHIMCWLHHYGGGVAILLAYSWGISLRHWLIIFTLALRSFAGCASSCQALWRLFHCVNWVLIINQLCFALSLRSAGCKGRKQCIQQDVSSPVKTEKRTTCFLRAATRPKNFRWSMQRSPLGLEITKLYRSSREVLSECRTCAHSHRSLVTELYCSLSVLCSSHAR